MAQRGGGLSQAPCHLRDGGREQVDQAPPLQRPVQGPRLSEEDPDLHDVQLGGPEDRPRVEGPGLPRDLREERGVPRCNLPRHGGPPKGTNPFRIINFFYSWSSFEIHGFLNPHREFLTLKTCYFNVSY